MNEKDYVLELGLTILLAVLAVLLFTLTGCSTKHISNGEFQCDCDCDKNSFECKLQIDKQTKLLHQEGEENGQDN